MNILVLTKSGRLLRRINLHSPLTWGMLSIGMLLGLALVFVSGYGVAHWLQDRAPQVEVDQMRALVVEQQQAVADARDVTEKQVAALAMRISELQARTIRLDALGGRLTQMAGLPQSEFSFGELPGVGGPDVEGQDDVVGLGDTLDELTARLSDQAQQLEVLEQVLLYQRLVDQIQPTGRPVEQGFISSGFGMRTDPFKGHQAMHQGIDFASREGTAIKAVGDGVVVYSGHRYGYGNMVEIEHGNGFVTRYAHNQVNLIKVNDRVERGEIIGRVGSTGHVTGPHLHFEVLRQGRAVDPHQYLLWEARQVAK
ncbi:MAG: peptidoglycan DD-metalloendopeptidase family protein, partial [Gammaproteobacteria bacterium]|nr:peptidoglycan DD-metalloendopeptidase family protein [Gammaproteobacteria bacterium]